MTVLLLTKIKKKKKISQDKSTSQMMVFVKAKNVISDSDFVWQIFFLKKIHHVDKPTRNQPDNPNEHLYFFFH